MEFSFHLSMHNNQTSTTATAPTTAAVKVTITITPEMGWIAFGRDGCVVGSIADTARQTGWVVVSHVSGRPNWK